MVIVTLFDFSPHDRHTGVDFLYALRHYEHYKRQFSNLPPINCVFSLFYNTSMIQTSLLKYFGDSKHKPQKPLCKSHEEKIASFETNRYMRCQTFLLLSGQKVQHFYTHEFCHKFLWKSLFKSRKSKRIAPDRLMSGSKTYYVLNKLYVHL